MGSFCEFPSRYFRGNVQEVCQSLNYRSKYNLNAIAHDTTIEIIQQVLLKGVNLTEIFVDTVGDPAKYRLKLEEKFPGIAIVVEKKADATYPIVSAASICAKVTRDTSMVRWQFIEPNYKSEGAFGSGYPAGIHKTELRSKYCQMVERESRSRFWLPPLSAF